MAQLKSRVPSVDGVGHVTAALLPVVYTVVSDGTSRVPVTVASCRSAAEKSSPKRRAPVRLAPASSAPLNDAPVKMAPGAWALNHLVLLRLSPKKLAPV